MSGTTTAKARNGKRQRLNVNRKVAPGRSSPEPAAKDGLNQNRPMHYLKPCELCREPKKTHARKRHLLWHIKGVDKRLKAIQKEARNVARDVRTLAKALAVSRCLRPHSDEALAQ